MRQGGLANAQTNIFWRSQPDYKEHMIRKPDGFVGFETTRRTGDGAEEGLAGGADEEGRVAQRPPQRPAQPRQPADQLQVAVPRLGEAQA